MELLQWEFGALTASVFQFCMTARAQMLGFQSALWQSASSLFQVPVQAPVGLCASLLHCCLSAARADLWQRQLEKVEWLLCIPHASSSAREGALDSLGLSFPETSLETTEGIDKIFQTWCQFGPNAKSGACRCMESHRTVPSAATLGLPATGQCAEPKSLASGNLANNRSPQDAGAKPWENCDQWPLPLLAAKGSTQQHRRPLLQRAPPAKTAIAQASVHSRCMSCIFLFFSSKHGTRRNQQQPCCLHIG